MLVVYQSKRRETTEGAIYPVHQGSFTSGGDHGIIGSNVDKDAVVHKDGHRTLPDRSREVDLTAVALMSNIAGRGQRGNDCRSASVHPYLDDRRELSQELQPSCPPDPLIRRQVLQSEILFKISIIYFLFPVSFS
jgi:hypothetical protein